MKNKPERSVEEIVEEHFPLEFFLTDNCPVKAGEMFGDLHYVKWSDEQTKRALLKQDKVRQTLTAERQRCDEMLREAKRNERELLIGELRLRDMPDDEGCYPVYTANQMAAFLARENGDVNALKQPPTPLTNDKTRV